MNNLHGLRYTPQLPEGVKDALTYVLNKRALNPSSRTTNWRLKYTRSQSIVLQWWDVYERKWSTTSNESMASYAMYNRRYGFMWSDDFATTFPAVPDTTDDIHA